MLNNPSYLIKSRHDIYYFCYPLPIRAQGKAYRVSLSLQARCPREALRLAKALEYYSSILIGQMGLNRMTHAEIMSLLKDYYSEVPERSKSRIDADGPLSRQKIENISGELSRIDGLIENECDDIYDFYGLDVAPEDQPTHKDLQRIMERFGLYSRSVVKNTT